MSGKDHSYIFTIDFAGLNPLPEVPAETAIRDTLQAVSTDTHPDTPGNSPGDAVRDTLQSVSPGALRDSLQAVSPDTLRVPAPAPSPGSSVISTPGPEPVAGRESIWDRIDSRDREIKETLPETTPQATAVIPRPRAAAPEPAVPVEREFRHDASYYLNPEAEIPFSRELIFPQGEIAITHAGSQFVFIESGRPAAVNSSVTSYQAYLETDVSAEINHGLQYSASWIPGLVILSLILLAWIKLFYLQFLTPVLISAFSYKEAMKLYKNKNAPSQYAFIILHLIFAVNSGLFLLFVVGHFDLNPADVRPVLFFLGISTFIVLLFAFKSAALRLAGFLFDRKKLFAEFNHNISLYNKIFGMLLMPLIVGLLYADDIVHDILIYSGLALGAVFYLLQLVRGFEIIVRKEVSVFYLILYLCTFEIIPIFTVYKLLETFLI
jgi:hypothetical protein